MEEQKEHHMVLIAIIAIVAVVAIIAVVIALTTGAQSRKDVAGQGLSLEYCILFDHVCDEEDCYDASGHRISCPSGTAEQCHKEVYDNCYCRLINCKKSSVN